jgi:protoporphyrinogen oxidase
MAGAEKNHAVIVGAGLTGLVTGYHVASTGIPVTVFEGAEDFSAAAGLIPFGGTMVEPEFDPVLNSDTDLLELLDQLDARSLLEWHPGSFGIFLNGRTQPLDRPRSLLGFSSLGLIRRIRLIRQLSRLLGSNPATVSEDLPAERWLEKQCGKDATAALWNPVLHGFWGKKAARVSAAWMARRLARITEPSVSGDGTSAYLAGGLRVLAERLQRRIEEQGGRVLFGRQVQEVLTSSAGLMGVFVDGQVVDTSAVVLTQRPDHIRALSPGLPESFFERLEVLPFQTLIRLTLELDRPFGQIHRLLVCDGDLPFSELVEHTAWINPEQYGNRNLLHLDALHSSGDPALEYPEEKILDLFLDGLKRINPDFDRHWVNKHQLTLDTRSRPVPVAGSPLAAPVSSTPIPGIYLASEAAHGRRYRGPAASASIGRKIASLITAAAGAADAENPDHSHHS